MVFVDWPSLGICKHYMLGRCYYPETCGGHHPPREMISNLWEYHKRGHVASREATALNKGEYAQAGQPVNNNYKQDGVSGLNGNGLQQSLRGDTSMPRNEHISFEQLVNKHTDQGGAQEVENPNLLPVTGWKWQPATTHQEPVNPVPTRYVPSSEGEKKMASEDEGNATLMMESEETMEVGGGEVGLAFRSSPGTTSHAGMPPPPPPLPQAKPYRVKGDGTTSPEHIMGAVKRLSNGETKLVGPHPSTIRVSAQYTSQSIILGKLFPASLTSSAGEKNLLEAREDSWRLQGVSWLDNIRRSLQLPVRTFTTACVYYHKFRLAQPAGEYNWMDACAASLLTACKNEDTLKKSRDILAASYNLKTPAHEHLGADDPIFEAPSRVVVGLERLVLESSGFDFRSRSPHAALAKLAKTVTSSTKGGELSTAYAVCTDAHRTFAPLKQSASTIAYASLELSARLTNSPDLLTHLASADIKMYSTSRPEVMETLLDLLDLYTHHTASTILGTKFSLDDFLRIRLHYNSECTSNSIPRFTAPLGRTPGVKVSNGHPTPVSPPQVQTATGGPPPPEDGGTLRFMLEPQRAVDEKAEVQKYFTEEWEDYEEEIEVPVPRARGQSTSSKRQRSVDSRASGQDRAERLASSSEVGRGDRRERERHGAPRTHGSGSHRDRERERVRGDERDERDRTRPSHRERERERERGSGRDGTRDRDVVRDRERERERDRDRDRRYDERGSARYDERDRRYEERRGYERDGGRRYEDRHSSARRSHR